jgi:hypothetical protein
MASILIGLALFFQTQEFLPGIFKGLGRKIPGGRVLDILGGLPLLGVFLLAEWMAYSGTGNFSRLLGFVGVISLPLMGGIFPVLLLLAGRKKGDYVPGLVIRLLGNRLVVAAIYFLYLALIFTYGIFIYESLLERVLTISVAVVTLIVTWLMVRGGAFLPRLIFELQDDQRPGEQPRFSVVAGGQEIQAPISLTFQNQSSQELQAGEPFADLRSLQSALLQIPKETADIREAKVWTHTLTPEGDSAGIGSSVQVGEVGEPLKLADGLAVLPLPEGAQKVRITL